MLLKVLKSSRSKGLTKRVEEVLWTIRNSWILRLRRFHFRLLNHSKLTNSKWKFMNNQWQNWTIVSYEEVAKMAYPFQIGHFATVANTWTRINLKKTNDRFQNEIKNGPFWHRYAYLNTSSISHTHSRSIQ